MSEGHLGTLGRRAAFFQLQTLTTDLGWPGTVLLGLSLVGTVAAAARGSSPALPMALWLFLLPNALSVALFRMEAARYLLPMLPAAALLVANTTFSLARRWSGRDRWAATIGLSLLVLVPTAWAGAKQAALGGASTQQLARRWCEENLGGQDLLLQEAYGAHLRDSFAVERVRRHPSFGAADSALRQEFLARPVFRTVPIPMATSGNFQVTLTPPAGQPRPTDVWQHATEMNQIFYDPALLRGVDVVITSSAVRQRYENDPDRYPVQVAFYQLLDEYALIGTRFAPGHLVEGPVVTIYLLGDRFRALLSHQFASFSPYWWAHTIPLSYRQTVEELLVPSTERSGGAILGPGNRPALWVLSLEKFFNQYLLSFLMRMTHHLTSLQRYTQARPHAAAVLAMRPDEVIACLAFSLCCTEMGNWVQAQNAVENTLRVLAKTDQDDPRLRYELARIFAHLGKRDAAQRELKRVLQLAAPGTKMANRSRQMLEKIGAESQPDSAP
jgi:hypothetical protein